MKGCVQWNSFYIDKHHTLDTSQFHTASDLILFVGHCDLYFMDQ